MAYATYTSSPGATVADQPVYIFETSTGIPAIVLSATTGGFLNDTGYAVLDGSGGLSVIIDTAKTWTVSVMARTNIGKVKTY